MNILSAIIVLPILIACLLVVYRLTRDETSVFDVILAYIPLVLLILFILSNFIL